MMADAATIVTPQTGMCCIYGYMDANDAAPAALASLGDYGMLYNWYAAKNNRLDYMGWKVPTALDGCQLLDYANPEWYEESEDDVVVPGRLRAVGTTYWEQRTDITEYVTGVSGFDARGAGYRSRYNATPGFDALQSECYMWCSDVITDPYSTGPGCIAFSSRYITAREVSPNTETTDCHSIRLFRSNI